MGRQASGSTHNPEQERQIMGSLQLPANESSGNEELFGDLETYCMFIGYPRSGHSLIGFLLDAHPSMIIAHELHVLKHINAGYGALKNLEPNTHQPHTICERES